MNNIKYYTRINRFGNESEYASFNNIEFLKHGEYYVNGKYGRLHRYIYEYYHGPIPNGYDIHHIDFDKTNNNINNLQMLTRKEHRVLHMQGNKFKLGKQLTEKTKELISENHVGFYGKKHTEKTKELISKARKGNKHPRYKQRTPEMYEDIKNGMGKTEFKRKYTCSDSYYYNTKKEIQENANI